MVDYSIWIKQYRQIDFEALNNEGKVYTRMRLKDDDSVKHAFEAIVVVWDEWLEKLKSKRICVDVQLWFFVTKPYSFELVVNKVDNTGELRDNYFSRSEEKTDIDISDYLELDSRDYIWEHFIQNDFQFSKIDELTEEEKLELLSEGYAKSKLNIGTESEDEMFTKKIHDVLVLRRL
tara:strand:- start:87 stop:617 length:531 start_codon:yes stop_codon:yes gene_type:complete